MRTSPPSSLTPRPSPLSGWLIGARGAPSAHNTQPWRFAPLPDGRVRVGWDAARTLPAGDPTDRDLCVSLGAAVESACLRSALDGSPMTFVPAADEETSTVGHLRSADADPDPADRALARLLDVRQTVRTPHLPRPVSPATLTRLQAEAERFGCTLHVVAEQRAVRRLARLAGDATAALFADPDVHAELWRWLRLDPNDPAYRRDGLTAECLNLSGVALVAARLLMPPARMRWLVRLGIHHLLATDTERVVRRSTSLCLLTAPSDRRADLVRAGRALIRVWLLAAGEHLSAHPVSALLDCAKTAPVTLALFGAHGRAPASIFRLGACPPAPRSPRLPAEELLG